MLKRSLCFLFCLFFSFSLRAETDVVYQVFDVLEQDYIIQTNPKEIALNGLQALHDVDKNVFIKQIENNQIGLYQKDTLIKAFDLPNENASKEVWSDFCKEILKESSKISEKLDVLDFELPDRFAFHVFKKLDGYSNYFSTFGESEEKPFKIKRQFASRVVDNILLIRALSFQKNISERIKNVVEECSKCEGIILDLRGNHGGFFDESIKVADLFLDEGIIGYTLSLENNIPEYYSASNSDIAEGKPMVVLTDGLTASAAEVLAAALSEQNRAVLIGTKTYGKGTLQDVKKMSADRTMTVTTSFLYTPSGLKIDKEGLSPFICTGSSETCEKEDRVNQESDIARAVQFIKTGM